MALAVADRDWYLEGGQRMTREAWLEWRQDFLCASDVPGVTGASPYTSARMIWLEKCSGAHTSVESDKMRYGRYAEAMFARWFYDETGLTIAQQQTLVSWEWRGASLDALVYEGVVEDRTQEHALGLAEFKTEGIGPMWAEVGVPDHYYEQVQWQLHVSGMTHAWLVVLHGWRFEVLEVQRDEECIARLEAAGREFWFEHVVTGKPPVTTGHPADFEALALQYPTTDADASVVIDVSVWQLFEEAKKAIKDWEGVRDRYRAVILDSLGEAGVGTTKDGVPVCVYRTHTRTTIPTGNLPKWVRYRFGEQQEVRVLRAAPKQRKKGKR